MSVERGWPWALPRIPRGDAYGLDAGWPSNARAEHWNDPLWRAIMRAEGYDAVQRRIAAQIAATMRSP